MSTRSSRVRTAALFAGLALAVSACGSSTVSPPASSAASEAPASEAPASQAASQAAVPSDSAPASAAVVPTGQAPQICVLFGPATDPFWQKIKKGVDDGEAPYKALGGSVNYMLMPNWDNTGPDAAKLITTAASQGCGAIAGAIWAPDAQVPAFEAAAKAGIPLMIFNAGGPDAAKQVGSIGYVGTDEHASGVAAGEYAVAQGIKHGICVNDFPGASFAEGRCGGFKDGIEGKGGKYDVLTLPSGTYGNQTQVAQAIKAALLKDPSIDMVVTLGVSDEPANLAAIEQAGLSGKVKAGTFDTDEISMKDIQAGKLMFAADQQPYNQGFLATAWLNQHLMWGLDYPQYHILTGPNLITQDNVASALAGAAQGVR